MDRKPAFSAASRLLVLLTLALIVTGCSGFRESVHTWALNHELRQANLEEKALEINGKHIAYYESRSPRDDREVLLMVHGFAANKQNWIRLARDFRDDYHVVAIDLPGHGDSIQDPDLSYTVADQAGYLDAIMDALDVSSAHLTGSSMGGAIVAVFASTRPDRVKTLTLIAPAGVHEHPSELEEHLQAGTNPLIMEDVSEFNDLMDFVMEERPFLPWPISRVIAERHLANREINEVIFEDIRRDADADFGAVMEGIRAPTLILWGDKDRVLNVANAEIMHEHIQDSRLVILEGIGHAPMLETPSETARHMHSLLSP